jgi:prepilin-type processing-associated H-X9-DG protein
MLRQIICALALILIVPALLCAQPLADRVPSDALVYVGWAGTRTANGYASSRLNELAKSSDAQKLFTQTLPALANRVRAENAQAGEAISLVSAVGGRVWHNPTVFYWEGLDFTNRRQPMPRMGFICDAGDEANALMQSLQADVKNASRKIPISLKQDGNVISVIIGPASSATSHLSDDAQFKDTISKVLPNPAAAIYVNLKGIVKLLDEAPAAGPREQRARKKWTMVRDALGLNTATAAVWSGAFDGKDWAEQAFLAAPTPREGILSLLDAKPMTEDLLKRIPDSATMVGAKSANLSQILAQVRATAGKVDPQAPQKIDQALDQFHSMTGLDLEKDVLAPLGDQWALFAARNVGGDNPLGFCLLNQLADPAKAEANLTHLAQSLGQLASGALASKHLQLHAAEFKDGAQTIHYLATPVIRPAWAVKDGVLYVGAYPQIVSAAMAISGEGKSILDNPAFVAVRKRLGDHPLRSLQYADLPQTAPMMYPVWLELAGYAGFADLFGASSPAMMIPPLNDLLAQLTPAGMISWVDDAGLHVQGISPFPGANLLGSDQTAMMGGAAGGAFAISILLPSLNRARETANRVKCASNERQIGQAILLYSNDHRGAYPPDLGTLYKETEPSGLAIEVFTCPSSDNSVPPNIRTAPLAQQAQWVNQHSSYIYIGKGLKNTAGADEVVLYEKPEDHDQDGMNLLYGDGHVSWEQMPRAQEEIHKPRPNPHHHGADTPGGL